MAVASPAFTGFRPEAIQFLADLASNNDRAWFQPRKAEYERLLKEPLEALIAALAERFEARGIPLRADPARSPFRIYRDVRFSKDKSPYKTNIGASFPWVAGTGRWRRSIAHRRRPLERRVLPPPAGRIYVGGGIWHPEKPWIDAFRRRVADDPDEIRALVDATVRSRRPSATSARGHALQRVPAGYPADHPRPTS